MQINKKAFFRSEKRPKHDIDLPEDEDDRQEIENNEPIGEFDPEFFSGLGGSSPPPSELNDSQPTGGKAHAHPPPSEASTRSTYAIKLNNELRTVAAPNAKFEAFPPRRIFETASFLVSYGITSLEAFRTTDEIARKYLFGDLRKMRGLIFTACFPLQACAAYSSS